MEQSHKGGFVGSFVSDERDTGMGGDVTTPMPQYRCHKVVGALKIDSLKARVPDDGTLLLTPADAGFAPFILDAAFVIKHGPQTGGYYVVYADGYKSFSPAKAFEEGYTPLSGMVTGCAPQKRQKKPATLGRIVLYVLTQEDAEKINRRRTNSESIAERMDPAKFADVHWPAGAQAHIGNTVEAGMEFPAMCVRDWRRETEKAGSGLPDNPAVNLQVFLDGNDVYWATSVHQAQGDHPELEYGKWHWPTMV